MKEVIGKNIRTKRTELGLTQKELASDIITRNMLSLIESGKALPSLDVLFKIAKRLGVTPQKLLCEENSAFLEAKNENIENVRALFWQKNYEECMRLIDSLPDSDDELSYVYAYSAFYHGKRLMDSGSLSGAKNFFLCALSHCEKTVYCTDEIKITSKLYLAVCENIQSPLLEMDTDDYLAGLVGSYDYEFFKYITPDLSFEYRNPYFRRHVDAKILMKKYKFAEAIAMLTSLEDDIKKDFNAAVLFNVYSDLEVSYRQMGDFEKAYRYSTKKISLLNAFKG